MMSPIFMIIIGRAPAVILKRELSCRTKTAYHEPRRHFQFEDGKDEENDYWPTTARKNIIPRLLANGYDNDELERAWA